MLTLAADTFSKEWFMEDPTGQKVGIAIAAVVGLIAIYFLISAMKWAVAYRREIIIAAIVICVGMYALNALTSMGLVGILIMGFVGMGLVFGFALLKTKG